MRKIILPVMAGASLLGFTHAKASAPVYVAAPTPANVTADGWFHRKTPWVLSIRGGTLGIGPEIMYHRKYSHWGVRADFDTFNYGVDNVYKTNSRFHTMYEGADVHGTVHTDYSGNVKLMNGSVYGDYYPWRRSAFRLTGGLIFSTNGLTADGQASVNGVGTLTRDFTLTRNIMGHDISRTISKTFSQNYQVDNAGHIDGKMRYNPVAPYVGIGFNTMLGGGFYLNGDLGAMFQTYTHVSLRPTGLISQYAEYQKDLKTAHDKIEHYSRYALPVYPVAMIGIGYRF